MLSLFNWTTFFTLVFGVCLATTVCAQSNKTSSSLKLAYNATVIYPGFLAGIECPVKQIQVTKHRRRGSVRHYTKIRLISAEIGYYHHPTFHDNLYLLIGWLKRKQRPSGFFTECSPAIGYSRTFLGGETYRVSASGDIKVLKLAGYNYAMVALRSGLGYSFQKNTAVYLRASLMTMFPSNNLIYIRPTVELGIIWRPKHFLETRTKIVSKSKGKKS